MSPNELLLVLIAVVATISVPHTEAATQGVELLSASHVEVAVGDTIPTMVLGVPTCGSSNDAVCSVQLTTPQGSLASLAGSVSVPVVGSLCQFPSVRIETASNELDGSNVTVMLCTNATDVSPTCTNASIALARCSFGTSPTVTDETKATIVSGETLSLVLLTGNVVVDDDLKCVLSSETLESTISATRLSGCSVRCEFASSVYGPVLQNGSAHAKLFLMQGQQRVAAEFLDDDLSAVQAARINANGQADFGQVLDIRIVGSVSKVILDVSNPKIEDGNATLVGQCFDASGNSASCGSATTTAGSSVGVPNGTTITFSIPTSNTSCVSFEPAALFAGQQFCPSTCPAVVDAIEDPVFAFTPCGRGSVGVTAVASVGLTHGTARLSVPSIGAVAASRAATYRVVGGSSGEANVVSGETNAALTFEADGCHALLNFSLEAGGSGGALNAGVARMQVQRVAGSWEGAAEVSFAVRGAASGLKASVGSVVYNGTHTTGNVDVTVVDSEGGDLIGLDGVSRDVSVSVLFDEVSVYSATVSTCNPRAGAIPTTSFAAAGNATASLGVQTSSTGLSTSTVVLAVSSFSGNSSSECTSGFRLITSKASASDGSAELVLEGRSATASRAYCRLNGVETEVRLEPDCRASCTVTLGSSSASAASLQVITSTGSEVATLPLLVVGDPVAFSLGRVEGGARNGPHAAIVRSATSMKVRFLFNVLDATGTTVGDAFGGTLQPSGIAAVVANDSLPVIAEAPFNCSGSSVNSTSRCSPVVDHVGLIVGGVYAVDVTLCAPPVGAMSIQFAVGVSVGTKPSSVVSTTLSLHVVPGDAVSFCVVTDLSGATVDDEGQLGYPLEFGMVDVAGNVLVWEEDATTDSTAWGLPVPSTASVSGESFVLQSAGGVDLPFVGVSTLSAADFVMVTSTGLRAPLKRVQLRIPVPAFGLQYRVVALSDIGAAATDSVERSPCVDGEWAPFNSTFCRAPPAGRGACRGGTDSDCFITARAINESGISTADGYLSAGATCQVAWYCGDRCTPTGCATGYAGPPLCTGAADGYADRGVKCDDAGKLYPGAVILLVVFLGICMWGLRVSNQYGDEENWEVGPFTRAVSIVLIGTTYLQILAIMVRLEVNLPLEFSSSESGSFTETLFSVANLFLDYVNGGPLMCYPSLKHYSSMILLCFVMILLVIGRLVVFRKASTFCILSVPMTQMGVPLVVKSIGEFDCIAAEPQCGVPSLLRSDSTVDCDSQQYQQIVVPAAIFTAVVLLSITVGAFVGLKTYLDHKPRGRASRVERLLEIATNKADWMVRHKFPMFMYKNGSWWWGWVNLLRTIAPLLIATFTKDALWQLVAVFLCQLLFLLTHLYATPFMHWPENTADILSFQSALVTASMAMFLLSFNGQCDSSLCDTAKSLIVASHGIFLIFYIGLAALVAKDAFIVIAKEVRTKFGWRRSTLHLSQSRSREGSRSRAQSLSRPAADATPPSSELPGATSSASPAPDPVDVDGNSALHEDFGAAATSPTSPPQPLAEVLGAAPEEEAPVQEEAKDTNLQEQEVKVSPFENESTKVEEEEAESTSAATTARASTLASTLVPISSEYQITITEAEVDIGSISSPSASENPLFSPSSVQLSLTSPSASDSLQIPTGMVRQRRRESRANNTALLRRYIGDDADIDGLLALADTSDERGVAGLARLREGDGNTVRRLLETLRTVPMTDRLAAVSRLEITKRNEIEAGASDGFAAVESMRRTLLRVAHFSKELRSVRRNALLDLVFEATTGGPSVIPNDVEYDASQTSDEVNNCIARARQNHWQGAKSRLHVAFPRRSHPNLHECTKPLASALASMQSASLVVLADETSSFVDGIAAAAAAQGELVENALSWLHPDTQIAVAGAIVAEGGVLYDALNATDEPSDTALYANPSSDGLLSLACKSDRDVFVEPSGSRSSKTVAKAVETLTSAAAAIETVVAALLIVEFVSFKPKKDGSLQRVRFQLQITCALPDPDLREVLLKVASSHSLAKDPRMALRAYQNFSLKGRAYRLPWVMPSVMSSPVVLYCQGKSSESLGHAVVAKRDSRTRIPPLVDVLTAIRDKVREADPTAAL